MSVPLLQTKVIPPQAHLAMLPRPHLLERLNDNLINSDGFSRKLTLICAPAGYGKTSLTVDWVRHQPALLQTTFNLTLNGVCCKVKVVEP